MRHREFIVPRAHRVADSRKQFCDRIGLRHKWSLLPARLDHARQLAVERIFAQAKPAHLETPIVRARASAQRTAVVLAHFEFLFAGCFDPQARFSHSTFSMLPAPARAAALPRQRPQPWPRREPERLLPPWRRPLRARRRRASASRARATESAPRSRCARWS